MPNVSTMPRSDRRLIAGIALALVLASALIYAPTYRHDFVNWDDFAYVTENDHVRGGISGSGILWAFTHSHSGNWHPLTWISHMVDCQLFGLHSGAHHLVNVAFHTANTLLLFALVQALTGAVWRGGFIAALFALHPIHVESVAWVAERKDVLSTFFFLLTILAYVTWARRREGGNARSERTRLPPASPGWYWLAFAFFALGLMSKPMLVTLPFVLLLVDYWPLRRFQAGGARGEATELWRLAREKWPFFVLTALSSGITVWAQRQEGAVASLEHVPLGFRIQNAAVAYMFYLIKFLFPANLSPIYFHPGKWAAWRVVGSFVLLGTISLCAWRYRRRLPWLFTGWFWFLGTLVPVIGIVQVGNQAFADRYTYIPLIGIMIVLAWLGAAGARALRIPRAGVAAIPLLFLGLLTRGAQRQTGIWKNTETLFKRALELNANNPQAMFGLGSYLIDSGRLQEGKSLLEALVQSHPNYSEALGTLARALDAERRYGDAIRYYEAALALRPDHPALLNNLAWIRAACPEAAFRNGPEAVRLATKACDLTGYGKPLFVGTLAAACAEAGDFTSAIATAQRAAALASELQLKEIAARNMELIRLYRSGHAAHGGPPGTNQTETIQQRGRLIPRN